MPESLEPVIAEVRALLADVASLNRAVFSGRRRNCHPEYRRTDLKPVAIKGQVQLQVVEFAETQAFTRNVAPQDVDATLTQLFAAGYSNVVIESAIESLELRITKSGEAQVRRSAGVQPADLAHDRAKKRVLREDSPLLRELGISDAQGRIKPSRMDKFKQIDTFLQMLKKTVDSALEAGQLRSGGDPLVMADLGCGHAYLTFAAHEFLRSEGLPVRTIGIDVREVSRQRNSEIAQRLNIADSIEFRAQEINDATDISAVDIAIALHACDTATDDALAWAVERNAALILVAPCCHHDMQEQVADVPEPYSILTKHGLLRERLLDLMTDAIRAHILRLVGYRVDAIEFVAGEHTPRNLMIRGVRTGAPAERDDIERYEQLIAEWNVRPALAARLSPRMPT